MTKRLKEAELVELRTLNLSKDQIVKHRNKLGKFKRSVVRTSSYQSMPSRILGIRIGNGWTTLWRVLSLYRIG